MIVACTSTVSILSLGFACFSLGVTTATLIRAALGYWS